eukprot:scaffold13974_cov115-Isochrysis_galbana.AAC.1
MDSFGEEGGGREDTCTQRCTQKRHAPPEGAREPASDQLAVLLSGVRRVAVCCRATGAGSAPLCHLRSTNANANAGRACGQARTAYTAHAHTIDPKPTAIKPQRGAERRPLNHLPRVRVNNRQLQLRDSPRDRSDHKVPLGARALRQV